MSNRKDITDGAFATTKKNGLIYTEELGWVDLGHAQGNDARRLKSKLDQEWHSTYYKEFNDWYFPVSYNQEMIARKNILGMDLSFQTGVFTKIMVRSCLSPFMKARVALTLMYGTAKRFEAWQNSLLFRWYSDSGFSAEDLLSDLVGFYRVFGSGPDPLWLAKPVSYQTAIQIWDASGSPGKFKNRKFAPYLFQKKVPFKYGVPIKRELPKWMNYINPLDHANSGLLFNEYKNSPIKSYFRKDNQLNHELYGTISIKNSKTYSTSPFERPLFFLLNPHTPVSRW